MSDCCCEHSDSISSVSVIEENYYNPKESNSSDDVKPQDVNKFAKSLKKTTEKFKTIGQQMKKMQKNKINSNGKNDYNNLAYKLNQCYEKMNNNSCESRQFIKQIVPENIAVLKKLSNLIENKNNSTYNHIDNNNDVQQHVKEKKYLSDHIDNIQHEKKEYEQKCLKYSKKVNELSDNLILKELKKREFDEKHENVVNTNNFLLSEKKNLTLELEKVKNDNLLYNVEIHKIKNSTHQEIFSWKKKFNVMANSLQTEKDKFDTISSCFNDLKKYLDSNEQKMNKISVNFNNFIQTENKKNIKEKNRALSKQNNMEKTIGTLQIDKEKLSLQNQNLIDQLKFIKENLNETMKNFEITKLEVSESKRKNESNFLDTFKNVIESQYQHIKDQIDRFTLSTENLKMSETSNINEIAQLTEKLKNLKLEHQDKIESLKNELSKKDVNLQICMDQKSQMKQVLMKYSLQNEIFQKSLKSIECDKEKLMKNMYNEIKCLKDNLDVKNNEYKMQLKTTSLDYEEKLKKFAIITEEKHGELTLFQQQLKEKNDKIFQINLKNKRLENEIKIMKDYDSHKTQKSDIKEMNRINKNERKISLAKENYKKQIELKNIIDNIDHETSKIVDYISLICLENPALLLNNDIFEKNIKAEDRIRKKLSWIFNQIKNFFTKKDIQVKNIQIETDHSQTSNEFRISKKYNQIDDDLYK